MQQMRHTDTLDSKAGADRLRFSTVEPDAAGCHSCQLYGSDRCGSHHGRSGNDRPDGSRQTGYAFRLMKQLHGMK
ncbi:hypothetical protein BH23CHL2_BH23CHL2_30850 [soil metagenome]